MNNALELPVREFLARTAAREPVPGGGSVSALVGALGAALGSMSALYTTGPKFPEAEPAARQADAALTAARLRLESLVQGDMDAYAALTAARALPKSSPDEKAARTAAINATIETATQVPEQILAASLEALQALAAFAPLCNPRLASDVTVSALFLEACARGAVVQLKANSAPPERLATADAILTQCRQIAATMTGA